MGAWGAGSFENDAAIDFSAEIELAEDLLRPLILDTPNAEIDVELASCIVVVGECVAAMRGHPSSGLPADLYGRLKGFAPPSKSLYHHTRDHLAAVMTRGELMDLWTEGDASEWNGAMHDLLERLDRKANMPPETAPPSVTEPDHNPSPCMFCDNPMGAEEFSMFNMEVGGEDFSMGMGGFAHLACLNRALHPKHMIRKWTMHDEDMPRDLDALLETKPQVKD